MEACLKVKREIVNILLNVDNNSTDYRSARIRDRPKPHFMVSAVAGSGPKLNIQLRP